jgi:hypothetical protein
MKYSLLIFTVITFFSGCVKEEIDIQNINSDSFDPSFATPIGNATFQIGRINDRTNRFLEVNPNTGVLEFSFDSPSFSYGISDFNIFPNQTISSSTAMNSSQVAAFNSLPTGSSYNFQTSNSNIITLPSSELLDSVIINNGVLSINILSNYTHSLSVVVTIPSLVKNGIVYSTIVPLNYVSTTPVTATVNLQLAGYKLDLTDGGITNNSIRISYNTTAIKGPSTANTSESVNFNLNLVLNEVEKIHGYFGNRVLTLDDTLDIDFLKGVTGGTINFADPRIELSVINEIGIPFDAVFTSISAWENTINQNIGGPGLTSIPLISAPNLIGDSTITNHLINNGNTTPILTAIINERPTKIAYSTAVQLNPNGITNNFITLSSRLQANAKFVIPLNGYGDGFQLSDTNSTKLEDIIGLDSTGSENLKGLTIRILATNGMPLEVGLQLYFLDNNNFLIDSLFTSGYTSILAPGTVNFSVPVTAPNYGKLISPSSKIFDIVISKDKYQKLIANNQAKIVYQTKMNTTGSSTMKNIKIFPEDYVKLKVSAKIDLKISLN